MRAALSQLKFPTEDTAFNSFQFGATRALPGLPLVTSFPPISTSISVSFLGHVLLLVIEGSVSKLADENG